MKQSTPTHISPRVQRSFLTVSARGRDLLLDPLTNKGTAFPTEEREALGLLGLLPPAQCTIEQQLERAYDSFSRKQTPLDRYIFLASLQDRNEVLFYRLLHDHIEEMMPIVYTPTVGEACQRFSHIYRSARGVHVAWRHKGRIAQVLSNYHHQDPSVIVVTDGERILGLGDQGVGGMGIPVGKLCLYTLCAGIPPETTLPIMLDIGTDNEELLADPLYLGTRQRRVRGEVYQEFVDEFVETVQEIFPHTILQWEDFLKENAMIQLARTREKMVTFNDDIQGTAAVTMAGLMAGLRVTGGALREQRILVAGAGASAQGISELFVSALVDEGVSERDARARVWMIDRHGLVTRDRKGLEGFKLAFARDPAEVADWSRRGDGMIDLEEAAKRVRPTILIGTSATPGLFSESVIRSVGAGCARPLIFPLSNPTSKTECTPEDALRWTEGRALVATGSPFDPVTLDGRTHRIGQCNNSFIFPGVGLGIWVGQARRVTDGMFLEAARALAHAIEPSDLTAGSLYPRLERIRDLSHAVACAVIRRAVAENLADPRLEDGLEETVRRAMWFPAYRPFVYRP